MHYAAPTRGKKKTTQSESAAPTRPPVASGRQADRHVSTPHLEPRDGVYARLGSDFLRGDLVPHLLDRVRRGPNELNARLLARLGERGVFAQEAVPKNRQSTFVVAYPHIRCVCGGVLKRCSQGLKGGLPVDELPLGVDVVTGCKPRVPTGLVLRCCLGFVGWAGVVVSMNQPCRVYEVPYNGIVSMHMSWILEALSLPLPVRDRNDQQRPKVALI